MSTLMTKQQFITQLSTELPESDQKAEIIAAAKKLVPSDTDQKQLYSLHFSRQIQRAVKAYHELNPETIKDKPNIENVVTWLMEMGAVDYSRTLERKLLGIHEYVMSFGLISLGETFTIPMDELLWMRILSGVDPKMIKTKVTG